MKKSILTIAGADPSGGAGIQRDIKTFEYFGLNALSVITSLTAQNYKMVAGIFPISPSFVIKQINCLRKEYRIDVIKMGMLARADIVIALANLFKKAKFKKLVLDPVLKSSSNYPLIDKKGISSTKKYLLPFVTIVTPNLDEAAILSDEKKIVSIDDMKRAAIKIKGLGPKFVLVKGGHLNKDRGQKKFCNKAIDILYDGKEFEVFEAKRINKDIHGTGCILSAAIASCLANGMDIKDAVREAKVYISHSISELL